MNNLNIELANLVATFKGQGIDSITDKVWKLSESLLEYSENMQRIKDSIQPLSYWDCNHLDSSRLACWVIASLLRSDIVFYGTVLEYVDHIPGPVLNRTIYCVRIDTIYYSRFPLDGDKILIGYKEGPYSQEELQLPIDIKHPFSSNFPGKKLTIGESGVFVLSNRLFLRRAYTMSLSYPMLDPIVLDVFLDLNELTSQDRINYRIPLYKRLIESW